MNLRDFTSARVELDRSGSSLATKEVLAFQLAHAMARDAVHFPLDVPGLQVEFGEHGWGTLAVHSQASDRATYLRRPDLGRRLAQASEDLLRAHAPSGGYDVCVLVADGLSALAAHRHAAPLLCELLPRFGSAGWSRSNLILVEQGRVAIADEVAHLLNARLAIVLIGERPGLSSPDSLGAYLTWEPRPGRTDAERNCISNIRPQGLGYAEAAERIFDLAAEARRRRVTGVSLKEQRGVPLAGSPHTSLRTGD